MTSQGGNAQKPRQGFMIHLIAGNSNFKIDGWDFQTLENLHSSNQKQGKGKI